MDFLGQTFTRNSDVISINNLVLDVYLVEKFNYDIFIFYNWDCMKYTIFQQNCHAFKDYEDGHHAKKVIAFGISWDMLTSVNKC